MKKFKLLSLLAVLTAFASCSSDDEPTNLATETTGTYSGYTVAGSNYFSSMVSANQSVTITSSELNKANISFVSSTWGTITITDADLTGSTGNVVISGSGKSVMGHAGSSSEYDCTATGTLVGKDLALTFKCPQVMGGLTIEFKQGDIPSDIVVPGTYSGYTVASSTYFSDMTADDQTIVISQVSGDTYKVTYTSDTWGTFTIDSAKAEYNNGTFTISGDGTTQMGMNDNIKTYDCSITGTIDAEKEDPTFTFTVPSVMGGLSIVFHTGDMPDAE